MKNLIAVVFALVLTVGCGTPAAKQQNPPPPPPPTDPVVSLLVSPIAQDLSLVTLHLNDGATIATTAQVSATAYLTSGMVDVTAYSTFVSSNPNIIVVDANGLITGVPYGASDPDGTGTAIITTSYKDTNGTVWTGTTTITLVECTDFDGNGICWSVN